MCLTDGETKAFLRHGDTVEIMTLQRRNPRKHKNMTSRAGLIVLISLNYPYYFGMRNHT